MQQVESIYASLPHVANYNEEDSTVERTDLATFLSWIPVERDISPKVPLDELLTWNLEDFQAYTDSLTPPTFPLPLENTVGEGPLEEEVYVIALRESKQRTLLERGRDWLQQHALEVELFGALTLSALSAIIFGPSAQMTRIESTMIPPAPEPITETNDMKGSLIITRAMGVPTVKHPVANGVVENAAIEAALPLQPAYDFTVPYKGVDHHFAATQWDEITQWDPQIDAMLASYYFPESWVQEEGITWRDVFHAMMLQESGGNPLAINAANSAYPDIGLMQINGSNPMGYTQEELWKPENNLDAAGRLMQQKVAIFGTLEGALDGYGPGTDHGHYGNFIITIAKTLHTFSTPASGFSE